MKKAKENHGGISEQKSRVQREAGSTDRQEEKKVDSGKGAGIECSTSPNFQPIATELADDDEKFQSENSSMEQLNHLDFAPREPEVRVPTDFRIKSLEQSLKKNLDQNPIKS